MLVVKQFFKKLFKKSEQSTLDYTNIATKTEFAVLWLFHWDFCVDFPSPTSKHEIFSVFTRFSGPSCRCPGRRKILLLLALSQPLLVVMSNTEIKRINWILLK
ncbi:hypothetical protein TNCV_3131681 [Trichonephila clavipes]|nr:hypothetical protein TNCV_3131681 [Trichonephila clavipes]